LSAYPSPNCGPRRDDARPDIVVIHYTATPGVEPARTWLCSPEAEVSAHYLVAPDGAVEQLVAEADRAWHAGAGAWGDVTDVNSRSIGIELVNAGSDPFPDAQMTALEALLDGIVARWGVPPERVIGHSDMAPGRKIDPGPLFDWGRLARRGLAIAVRVPWWRRLLRRVDAARFRADLARAGYTAEAAPEVLLQAFRLRHRPGATGPLGRADCALAAELARRFPVDRGRPAA